MASSIDLPLNVNNLFNALFSLCRSMGLQIDQIDGRSMGSDSIDLRSMGSDSIDLN
jgi:hypothetical protein